jgi:SPP1 family predicted phage head-tail adaptor
MRAGRLNRRVELLRPVVTRGAAGEQVETLTLVGRVWAGRRDLRARELAQGSVDFTAADAVYEIRWRTDVQRGWRVREGDQVFEVEGLADIGTREGLELRCIARRDALPLGEVRP